MDINYTKDEGRLILSVVLGMVLCDGEYHSAEEAYVNKLVAKLGLTQEDVNAAKLVDPFDAFDAIFRMSAEKILMAKDLIIYASLADGKIVVSELKFFHRSHLRMVRFPSFDPDVLTESVNSFLES